MKQLTNLGNVLISASPTDRTEVLKAAAPNVLTNLQRFERVLKFMKGETPNSRSGRKTKSLLPKFILKAR